MTNDDLPPDFVKRLKAITKKRPQAVITHILAHGFITTEELTSLYGYEHPPRAARDVREEGIPLETFRVKNSNGRSIGAYRFGDLSEIRSDRLGGRKVFSKQFKQALIAVLGSRCTICGTVYQERYLQVDHRIPYEVAGDLSSSERKTGDYMLLCASCNRAKSWSCEHCENWLLERKEALCLICYWAAPEDYKHIALRDIRRVDVVWSESEVSVYEKIKQRSRSEGKSIPEYVRKILREQIE